MSKLVRLRNLWWSVHRWIGIGLALPLVPIALSGALLVWHDPLDAVLHPARYAVTGSQFAQPSAYLASARAVLDPAVQPVTVRYPQSDGWPVMVQARGARGGGGPPRFLIVYLDPPSARVLDIVDFRTSLIGILHRFHENLTIPQYSGRAIVGWAGVGTLMLALTGIWLWWPRGAFIGGLRWRRSGDTLTNLHHLLGFCLSVPLALVALTGIYLSFPPQARSLMSSVAAMNPQPPRPNFSAAPARNTRLTPDDALAAAVAAEPAARPAALFLPSAGARRGEERGPSSPIWRIQMRKSVDGQLATLMIADDSSTVRRLPDPLAGDRAAQWIRWVHEGSHSGPLWQVIVFLTGVGPPVFAVTGILMWLRRRRAAREQAKRAAPATATGFQPAE
jgi:uncharacterized iron-regulated membrane protein